MAKNAVSDWSATAGSNTDVGGISLAEGSGGQRIPAINNAFREIMKQIADLYPTLVRTGGTDLPLADGGTGASLSDPGADRIMFWDDSAGAVTWLTAGAGLTITTTTMTNDAVGVHSIWVPAYAMVAATTNGAADGTAETSTNKVMVKTKDFDASTEEFVQFMIRMPKSWNESTITASFVWTHGATTTNFGVAWGIEGLAFGDSDALDVSWGTEVAVTDTGGTTDDVFTTAATAAVTIGGTPQPEDLVAFRITRVVGNASDNMAVDAKLLGVTLYYTTNAGNDA